jgi:ADP-ribosylation factor GTPase-activating protein 1
MDAFKAVEIERMRLGGNKPWRDFFEQAEANQMAGIRYVLHSLLCIRIEGEGG